MFALAQKLLTRVRLVAGGVAFRVADVEAYYFGPGHEDPFAHRHPVQQTPDVWYFHRTGSGYRGGTYKGLDLAFGSPGAFAGMLIRGIDDEFGTRTDGPCRVVDRLLRETGFASPAALDAAIGGRTAFDPGNPLRLEVLAEPDDREIFTSPRVGLSLKTATAKSSHAAYLLRPYRFLTDPRKCRAGRGHAAIGLLAAGLSPADVCERTGSPIRVVAGYAAAAGIDFRDCVGKIPTPAMLAGLLRAEQSGPAVDAPRVFWPQ